MFFQAEQKKIEEEEKLKVEVEEQKKIVEERVQQQNDAMEKEVDIIRTINTNMKVKTSTILESMLYTLSILYLFLYFPGDQIIYGRAGTC